jgi:glycogen(starch) synthase
MRILIVSEDIPHRSMGGLAKHVLTLCRGLVKEGHEVTLLGNTLCPPEEAGSEMNFGGCFIAALDGHFVGWKEKPFGAFMPPRRAWVAKRFARAIMQHASGYDVVHYHGHYPNVGKFIPTHVNFVQTRHDQGSDCLLDTRFRNGEICNEIRPEACAGCRAASPNLIQKTLSTLAVVRFRKEVAEGFQRHKTVFVSSMLQRNLQRTFGERQWGSVIHHFVDTEAIRRAREASAQMPRTDHRFHVVVSGKLYPVKGIGAFLKEVVPQLRSDMRITVVGDGGEGPALRTAYESDQVRFAGWCDMDKTLAIAATADAVVVPSLWEEAFGATTLEGLLLGKPVFALARGATPELAIYASAPDQLRLHPDMGALVTDLLNFEPCDTYPAPPPGTGGPERAVQQLLALYRMPPGNLVSMHEEPCPSVSQ